MLKNIPLISSVLDCLSGDYKEHRLFLQGWAVGDRKYLMEVS